MSALRVTTNVTRDILQSAALFRSEAAIVWEYVVNSLQYTNPGVPPKVQIDLEEGSGQIVISDNGRGMSADDLTHFFTMHGENRERREGRPGRGKFGTGKSAAFGIADELVVDTRRNGRRNRVRLTRQMITASAGAEVPVDWSLIDAPTNEPNGTRIEISGWHTANRRRRTQIIEYIERNLPHFRHFEPLVAVGSHVCEARQPTILREMTFRPQGRLSDLLGSLELAVYASTAPLSEHEMGIAVLSAPGSLVAIETGGVERKEMGNYLFGRVEAPGLELGESAVEPYDSSRSLRLNPMHPYAADLLRFISASLESARESLVADRARQRDSELQKRLARDASDIAAILNADFGTLQARLGAIRASAGAASTALSPAGFTNGPLGGDGAFVAGGNQPGVVPRTSSNNEGSSQGRDDPELPSPGSADETGADRVRPVGGDGQPRSRPRGGFQVAYEELGEEEGRSFFDESTLRLIINLSHPVIRAALQNSSLEDKSFRRLSYEIAFSEYAIALGRVLLRRDPDIPADDVIYEIRASLNRVALAARQLYMS